MNRWTVKEIAWMVFYALLALGSWFLGCLSAAKLVCLMFSYTWRWSSFMTAWTAITAILVWFSLDDQSAEKYRHWMRKRRIKKKCTNRDNE